MILALAFYVTMDGLNISALPIVYQRLDHLDSSAEGEYVPEYFAIITFWATLWCVKFGQLSMLYCITNGLAGPRIYWYIVIGFTILAIIGAVISNIIACSSMTAWFTPGITFDI